MNQQFIKSAFDIVADGAVVPLKLQIADRWIEEYAGTWRDAFEPKRSFRLQAGTWRDAFEPMRSFRLQLDGWLSVAHEASHEFLGVLTDTESLAEQSEPVQTVLDFPNVFIPSARLVALWNDGLAEFAKSGDRKDVDQAILNQSTSERSEAFVRRLHYVVALYAHQRRYEDDLTAVSLTEGKRFDLGFQLVVSEFLPLVPDRSDEFLSLLLGELIQALKAGWNLKSEEWGSVNLLGDEIVIRLRKPIPVEDADFEQSKEG